MLHFAKQAKCSTMTFQPSRSYCPWRWRSGCGDALPPETSWSESPVLFSQSFYDSFDGELVLECLYAKDPNCHQLAPENDGTIDNLASGWLLLLKSYHCSPWPSCRPSSRVTGRGFEFWGFEKLFLRRSHAHITMRYPNWNLRKFCSKRNNGSSRKSFQMNFTYSGDCGWNVKQFWYGIWAII